jgi:hypothetical protein
MWHREKATDAAAPSLLTMKSIGFVSKLRFGHKIPIT